MPEPAGDVSVIIVSYNGREHLERCLGALEGGRQTDAYEVIVVDNASVDNTLTMLRSRFPLVRVIANRTNIGFAAANNIGIRAARARFLLLLNPDTEVTPGAIPRVAGFLAAHPEAGIAGCRLVLPDGSVQRSARSFPTVWGLCTEALLLYPLVWRSRRLGRHAMGYFDYGRTSEVDWVSGAFFMIRRDVVERIGPLDEAFFMYSEEMDFCRRARNAGFSTWYVADATVHHFWGGVNDVNRRVILWTNGSQILYFRKHFAGVRRAALVALKRLGIAVRIPLYAVAGGVTLKKSWFDKMRFHASALRWSFHDAWSYGGAVDGRRSPWPR